MKVGNAMVSRGYTGKYTLFRYEKKKLPKLDALLGVLVIIASISVVLVDAFLLRWRHLGLESEHFSKRGSQLHESQLKQSIYAIPIMTEQEP